MSELPGPPTRKPGAIALALVVIAVLAAVFVWHGHRRDVMQRENAARVVQQTQAAEEWQRQAPASPQWQQTGAMAVEMQRPVALARTAKYLYVAGDRVVQAHYLGHHLEATLALPAEATAVAADDKRLAVGLRDRIIVYAAPLTQAAAPRQLLAPPTFGPRAFVTAMAFVGSEIWVADSGNRIIHRLRNGAPAGTLGKRDDATGYQGLLVPSPHLDLALAPSGRVVLNNPGKLRVETWAPAGKLITRFGRAAMAPEGFAGCCNPIAVAVLPDGRIVTAEKGLVRVKTYHAEGTFEALVATTPALSYGVKSLDLATTPAGEILVLDPRARKVLTFAETKRPSPQDSK